jgi:3-oxoacyl-[acyl-carrier protein] reductase
MMKLENKVAIITGAGSGIGRAIALRFAKEGADIAIVYSRNDANAQESAALVETIGRKAIINKIDISKNQACVEMVEYVANTLGKIDILVNNAGVYNSAPLLELPEDAWDQVLGVDLKGTFNCTQAVTRHMVKSGQSGKVINIGSIHGHRAWKGACNYATAKAGLINLTRAMALELADYGILVNLVSPGAIAAGPNATRLVDRDFMSRVEKEVPLKRMGEADEVANLVLFLASDESNYITGADIVIDGGLLLHPFTV